MSLPKSDGFSSNLTITKGLKIVFIRNLHVVFRYTTKKEKKPTNQATTDEMQVFCLKKITSCF